MAVSDCQSVIEGVPQNTSNRFSSSQIHKISHFQTFDGIEVISPFGGV